MTLFVDFTVLINQLNKYVNLFVVVLCTVHVLVVVTFAISNVSKAIFLQNNVGPTTHLLGNKQLIFRR